MTKSKKYGERGQLWRTPLLWQFRLKDQIRRELGFSCSIVEIGKVKWIFLTNSSVRGSAKNLHDRPGRRPVSKQRTQRSYPRCSEHVHIPLQPLSCQKRACPSLVHLPRTPVNGLRIMPATILHVMLIKLIPLGFLHEDLSNYVQIGRNIDSYQSLWICSFVQIDLFDWLQC